MSKRKYEKPPKAGTDFAEALERFAKTEPKKVSALLDEEKSRLVPLAEDDNGHRFLIYATERGIEARLRYEAEKFWLTMPEMARLFGRDLSVISRHVASVISDGELPEDGNLQKMQETPSAAGGRPATLCSLDMVISVAYRVTNSKQATMLRIWATDKLVQILTKGFYIDKERLKSQGEPDALDEFREIAREIRTSIRNSYREVLRLCTFCSDYDGSSVSIRPRSQCWRGLVAGAVRPLYSWPRPSVSPASSTAAVHRDDGRDDRRCGRARPRAMPWDRRR